MIGDHFRHAASHLFRGRDVQELVGPVRVGVRSEHSCDQKLRLRKALTQHPHKWNRAASRMGSKWQELGRKALGIAERELEGREIDCGIAHGDFAPWNMRIEDGTLRLFDWESATYHAPLLWDQFHFMTQTECLLKIRHDRESVADVRKENRSSYLLYLLNTVGQYWEEAAQDAVIRYREEQLLRFASLDERRA